MIYRHLRQDELEAWVAHCHGVFTDTEPDHFRRHFEQDPAADLSLIFVAMDGGTIASTVRVFRREVRISGRAVAMGGIGEVSTRAEYRRQGLAAELLALAIAAMEAQGMPVSILFGDARLYERAGWRFCPAREARAETDRLSALPEDAGVRPFAEADLPYLMGMYDLYMGRMDGAVQRSPEYWLRWVLPQWHAPWVLWLEGRPAAYCCAEVDDANRTLYVSELAAAPQAEALLPGLLRAVAGECRAVCIPAPLCPGLPGEIRESPAFMVRLNSPWQGLATSDALVRAMPNAGLCAVDSF